MDEQQAEELDPLLQIPGQKKFPQYRPVAYFGGNLLLGGLSYILLRQYRRFFGLIVLLFLTGLIPMIGSLLAYAILFGSCFDAYFIAKRYKESDLPEPEYNRTYAYIALAIWIISVVLVMGALIYASQTPAVLY